ncbi:zinc finger, CCHC-type containing protein [Tanacetum coccineum]
MASRFLARASYHTSNGVKNSKTVHEGYRNTIEFLDGNNVVALRSDTIQLVQNECSFHRLQYEDPNQHLKDFLKLVDSLDLDVANKERMRLCLFKFSLCDQASSWLKRLPVGSISTWEDLTTRFLAQFFLSGRTAKLRNDILMFQHHHGESVSEAWTRFKDLLQKVPHHGIDRWLQIQKPVSRLEYETTWQHTLKEWRDSKTLSSNSKKRSTTEMFGLLNELTTSRTPKKVQIREEARHPITKHVNFISIIRVEEEKNVEGNEVVDENVIESDRSDAAVPPKEVDKMNGAEN